MHSNIQLNQVEICFFTLTETNFKVFGRSDFSPRKQKEFSNLSKIQLAWICAFIDAYTALLLSFVIFKLFRVIFNSTKALNRLTLANYVLNLLL